MLLRTIYLRRRLVALVSVVVLLMSVLTTLAIAPPEPVVAQANNEPAWEVPPMFFRPSQNNFVADDDPSDSDPGNDPINVIVYGPNLTRGDINDLLVAAVGAGNAPALGAYIWQVNEGTGDFLGVPFNCANDVNWAPGDEADVAVHVGSDATSACPAIDPLGPLINPSVPFLRAKTRYWQLGPEDYPSAEFPNPLNSVSLYVAAGTTENFGRILPPDFDEETNPYDPLPPSDPLACGRAHCLVDYNSSRDDAVVPDLFAGAAEEGWTIREWSMVESPVHTNNQSGPYNSDFATDGDVRVICINKDGTTLADGTNYCDQKPAERPIALSNLTPANGSFLVPGQTTDLRVDLGYSDSFRAIDDVTFSLTYTDTASTQKTLIQTASLVSGDGNDGVWEAALAVPADVALDTTTGTQIAGLEIDICDNHGQQNGNSDDTACWTYRNLRYVLRDLPTCTDTAFVIDTTSSMDSILEEVQAAATEVVGQIFTANPDARIAVIEYRDEEDDPSGGDARTRLGLSGNQDAIVNAINSLSAGGGGDLPEFVLSGVMKAVNLAWREPEDKVILLIGDAGAKDPEPITGYTTSFVVDAAMDEGIAIYGLPVQGGGVGSFSSLANGTGGAIYPVNDTQSVVAAIQEACNLP